MAGVRMPTGPSGFDWAPGQGRPVVPGQAFTFCEDVRGTVLASHKRDRQWIARNLGDVPMRIVDTGPMPAVAMLREVGELAGLALADAEARYANHLGRNP
jgi:hypothetical protein